ncbi:MAG TPA: hypothetical protein VJC39_02275 [Candidatus Nanoarchaeia archaeon]|nr:hypothetical protein [Candidatus Nanoarchaeia archaeon]
MAKNNTANGNNKLENLENLADLSPRERIKKLKELKQKKEEEIIEAQELIHDSEVEIDEELKFKDKVPIPEVAQEDLEGLSLEAKDILKSARGMKEKITAHIKEEERYKLENIKDSLEETVGLERTNSRAGEVRNVEYGPDTFSGSPLNPNKVIGLSYQPAGMLQQEMDSIYRTVGEKGYMNQTEQQRVVDITSALDEKIRAVETGSYNISDEVARSVSIARQVGERLLHNTYQSNKRYAGEEYKV